MNNESKKIDEELTQKYLKETEIGRLQEYFMLNEISPPRATSIMALLIIFITKVDNRNLGDLIRLFENLWKTYENIIELKK